MSNGIDWSGSHRRRARWRQVVRRVVVIVVAVALLAIGLGSWRYSSEQTPRLSVKDVLPASVRLSGTPPSVSWPKDGEAAVEVEGVGSLGTSGSDSPQPIASLAKIMTAYLILRKAPLHGAAAGFRATVTSADWAAYNADYLRGESVVTVRPGETLTERQALEALLIPSGNNIATLLANYAAGSQAAFVTRMNAVARQLGMHHTTYVDASGFNSNTVSTPSDQLKLAAAAMEVPGFAQIVGMPTAFLPVEGKVQNYDTLAGQQGFLGIKTGSDSRAGGCFVFAKRASYQGRTLTVLGAVFGQDKGAPTFPMIGAALTASQALADSAVAAVRQETILPAGTTVAVYTNAEGKHVRATTAQAITGLGWGGLSEGLTISRSRVGTTLDQGQQVATVTLQGGGASTVARARSKMPGLTWHWRLHHVLPKFLR